MPMAQAAECMRGIVAVLLLAKRSHCVAGAMRSIGNATCRMVTLALTSWWSLWCTYFMVMVLQVGSLGFDVEVGFVDVVAAV